MNILADFAVKYHKEAAALGVDIQELYRALKTDGEVNPPEVCVNFLDLNLANGC